MANDAEKLVIAIQRGTRKKYPAKEKSGIRRRDQARCPSIQCVMGDAHQGVEPAACMDVTMLDNVNDTLSAAYGEVHMKKRFCYSSWRTSLKQHTG